MDGSDSVTSHNNNVVTKVSIHWRVDHAVYLSMHTIVLLLCTIAHMYMPDIERRLYLFMVIGSELQTLLLGDVDDLSQSNTVYGETVQTVLVNCTMLNYIGVILACSKSTYFLLDHNGSSNLVNKDFHACHIRITCCRWIIIPTYNPGYSVRLSALW